LSTSLRLVERAEEVLPEYAGRVALHPGQLALLESTAPITVVVAGIRGGKTHGGALKSILYAIEHPTTEDEHHLVLSPTYPMSKVPIEKLFKLLYDPTIFPICPLIRYVRSERMFILTACDGGITRLTVRSLHEPDRLRGMKALSAWIDEGAFTSGEAWEIVQGRLADSDGPCWITTTPDGYNWVYDLYEQARNGNRDVRVIHFTSLQNPFLKQSGFARLARQLDARTYAQEVGAKFLRARGLIYHAFRKAKHVQPRAFNPTLPVWIGQDFNVDPMATLIGQPITTRSGAQGVHFVGERLARDSNTPDLIAWVKSNICERYKLAPSRVTFYADASGKARTTTGRSDFYLLRAAGFKVEAPSRNPAVKDRINCVNGLLAPSDGTEARMLFDPSCTQAINCFSKHQYKPESDPPEPDKDSGFDHMTDAGGYLAWKRWPLRIATTLGNPGTTKRAA
jgi:hypothetical protein